MNDSHKNNKIIHRQLLFKALSSLSSTDYATRTEGMVHLREESLQSDIARSKLRDLIYDDDGCIRILAAEALSLTQSYPSDAIPVLEATLEAGTDVEITDKVEPWIRICLGALYNYGEAAKSAESLAWPYLYAQPSKNLTLYAARFISRFAGSTDATWTILCLLCRHEDPEIRNYVREIMKSDEFRDDIVKE